MEIGVGSLKCDQNRSTACHVIEWQFCAGAFWRRVKSTEHSQVVHVGSKNAETKIEKATE